MEERRELGLLNQRFPTLDLLGTMTGMIKNFRQVAEDPDAPVIVHADKQSAFRYFVKVMDAAKEASAVKLTLETESGS